MPPKLNYDEYGTCDKFPSHLKVLNPFMERMLYIFNVNCKNGMTLKHLKPYYYILGTLVKCAIGVMGVRISPAVRHHHGHITMDTLYLSNLE